MADNDDRTLEEKLLDGLNQLDTRMKAMEGKVAQLDQRASGTPGTGASDQQQQNAPPVNQGAQTFTDANGRQVQLVPVGQTITPAPGQANTVGQMAPTDFWQGMGNALATALHNNQSGTGIAALRAPAPPDQQRSGGTPSGGSQKPTKQKSLADPLQWDDRAEYANACAEGNPHDMSAGIMAEARWDDAHGKEAATERAAS